MPDNGEPFSIVGEKSGDITLFLSKRTGLDDFNMLFFQIKNLFVEHNPAKLTVDFTHVEYFDSSGALFLTQLEAEARGRSIPFSVANVSDQQKQILSLVDREALFAPALASRGRSLNFIEQLGNAAINVLRDVY